MGDRVEDIAHVQREPLPVASLLQQRAEVTANIQSVGCEGKRLLIARERSFVIAAAVQRPRELRVRGQ